MGYPVYKFDLIGNYYIFFGLNRFQAFYKSVSAVTCLLLLIGQLCGVCKLNSKSLALLIQLGFPFCQFDR